MSNACTLLIIYARIDLTPWYIECLYGLLVFEEVIDQFKLKIWKLNGDLLQPPRIRYEVRFFSVRYFISIAYWERLISGVNFVLAYLFAFIFISFSSCMWVFSSQSRVQEVLTEISVYIRGFSTHSHVCPEFFLLEEDWVLLGDFWWLLSLLRCF